MSGSGADTSNIRPSNRNHVPKPLKRQLTERHNMRVCQHVKLRAKLGKVCGTPCTTNRTVKKRIREGPFLLCLQTFAWNRSAMCTCAGEKDLRQVDKLHQSRPLFKKPFNSSGMWFKNMSTLLARIHNNRVCQHVKLRPNAWGLWICVQHFGLSRKESERSQRGSLFLRLHKPGIQAQCTPE